MYFWRFVFIFFMFYLGNFAACCKDCCCKDCCGKKGTIASQTTPDKSKSKGNKSTGGVIQIILLLVMANMMIRN